jgi:DNA-binding IclR family transcriptional regulator
MIRRITAWLLNRAAVRDLEDREKVLKALEELGPTKAWYVSQETKLSSGKVYTALLTLRERGQVTRLPDMKWTKT